MKKFSMMMVPFLLLTGCLEKEITKLDVKMINADGDSIGTVSLQEQSSGVIAKFDLKDLPSGAHAVHIHDKGKCIAPKFKLAGEDLNPEKKEHGLLHPKGAHAGDLPNIIVEEDGTVKAEIMAPNVTLKEGKTSLLTKEGTSIIIHEEKDDGMSQPAGDSGAPIACGEISKDKKDK